MTVDVVVALLIMLTAGLALFAFMVLLVRLMDD